MVLTLLTQCLLAITPIAPQSQVSALPDSAVSFDSSGAIQSFSRLYYNENGWPDSARSTDAESNEPFSLAMRYSWAGDTLVQLYVYDGESPTMETSRYLFNSAGIAQKQLHCLGVTLIETVYYYYNPAGKLIKEIITNFSGQWVGPDSIIYNYDNENHAVSTMEYSHSVGWYYTEFEHDAQGRIIKDISFVENSKTHKDRTSVYIYFNNPILNRFAEAPKKPGIRIDHNGALLSFEPSACRTVQIYDVKGALLKNIQLEEFNAMRYNGYPAKAYFIRAVTKNGTLVGKRIGVR